MPINERRHHFRVVDHIYFDYKIIRPGDVSSDLEIGHELLGKNGQKYVEAMQFFQNLDYEMTELSQIINLREPALNHYLSLLNSKIDYLARQILMTNNIQLRKVDISLGGLAFNTPDFIKEKTLIKLILYTKPKIIPVIIDAIVIFCEPHGHDEYRTSVSFSSLSKEHEQLISQHILLAQTKNPSY